jgi:multidrug efflux system outer membrane protein
MRDLKTYLQLRAAQMLRQTTVNLIADQQQVTDLTTNRQQHGLAGEADVQSARAQLANLQSQLPPFDQSIAISRHALAVLTGKSPTDMDATFGDTGRRGAPRSKMVTLLTERFRFRSWEDFCRW